MTNIFDVRFNNECERSSAISQCKVEAAANLEDFRFGKQSTSKNWLQITSKYVGKHSKTQ